MTHTEALRLALDALEKSSHHVIAAGGSGWKVNAQRCDRAIEACRAALGAPAAPEPVAPLPDCDSPKLCALQRACLGRYGTKARCAAPAAPSVPAGWREFVARVAAQKPEKPDYWSSCGQCERNASDAEDLLAAAPQPGAPTPTAAPVGMFRDGCNYAMPAGRICNKCGHVHTERAPTPKDAR